MRRVIRTKIYNGCVPSRKIYYIYVYIYIFYIYFVTAVGLTLGGSSTVHIYTQTIHKPTQLTTLVGRLCGIRTRLAKLIGKSAGRAPSMRVIP